MLGSTHGCRTKTTAAAVVNEQSTQIREKDTEKKRRKSTKHCCKNLSVFKKQSHKSQTGKLIKLITTENVELAERFSQNV